MSTVGRWTLLEVIGRGAAGTVWRATDFNRTVTVKIAEMSDPKAARSLAREGRILAQLDHPNLPRLIEVIKDPPALIMDSAPSLTYGDLLSSGQLWTRPLRERLETLTVIAAALDRLHEQGIIHGDVKPAHLTASQPPLLFDFGISHVASDTDPPDLDAGTAAYMPPLGEPVSAARDAYAFAVTAYELLLGAHPLLVATDRDIAPSTLRERAAAKVRAGNWRSPSVVPHWELPPDLRAAALTQLDALFSAGLGLPEARPSQLSKWMSSIRACIPPDDIDTLLAPDVLPEAFSAAHTAHEVAAALRTDGGTPVKSWRGVLVAAVFVAVVVLAILLLRR